MKEYQSQFINLALESQALTFGEFTLKSGRISPYFFNAGMFRTGLAISNLGACYAEAMIESNVKFDMLLGPAYKGIPLVTSVGIAYANRHDADIPIAYTRKEVKNHGEGGSIVGSELKGKIAIIDDVITAGTAVREVLSMISAAGAEASAVVVGLDRQERGRDQRSAIKELEDEYQLPVISIVRLADIIEYVRSQGDQGLLENITAYREKYGV